MKHYLDQVFETRGDWFRGNLHSHTTVSDGRWTPEEAVRQYRAEGYSFLAFTDHDRFTDWSAQFDTQDFCILPGVEASTSLRTADRLCLKTHHLLGIAGTREMLARAEHPFAHMEKLQAPNFIDHWDGAAAAQTLCDNLRSHGCFVIYNHPVWSRVEEAEFVHTRGLTALEIFNFATVNECGEGYDAARWDVMLRAGTDLFAMATDDNHNGGCFPESFGGYLMVNAEKPAHEELVRAILDGNYYSSSGPEIYNWGVRDDQAYIRCSPAARIILTVGGFVGSSGASIAPKGQTLTEASFPLCGRETYVRAECIDSGGRAAWTNHIRLARA